MKIKILIFGVTICFSCQATTSSDERFEKNIGFALPEDKKITKDEYQDMLQDYTVIYEVELSPAANQLMINRVKALVDKHSDQDCGWTSLDVGFAYQCEKNRTTYHVEYDTIRRKVSYEEGAD